MLLIFRGGGLQIATVFPGGGFQWENVSNVYMLIDARRPSFCGDGRAAFLFCALPYFLFRPCSSHAIRTVDIVSQGG